MQHGCSLLLQMSHIACSEGVCLSVCWSHGCAVQKQLNEWRCRLGADLCGLNMCYMGSKWKNEEKGLGKVEGTEEDGVRVGRKGSERGDGKEGQYAIWLLWDFFVMFVVSYLLLFIFCIVSLGYHFARLEELRRLLTLGFSHCRT